MADFFIISQPTSVWEFQNPTLEANCLGVCSDIRNGVETDTGLAKLGNSVDDWDTLPYFSPSDSAVWGEITGTLSDQTDLQSALDAKMPEADVLRSYLADTITYNNDDTLGDTPLSVTVASGGIYDIELTLYHDSVVSSIKADFAGTATIANFIGQWFSGPVAQTPAAGLLVTAAGTDANIMGDTDGAEGYTTFRGTAEFTDAGTFLLRSAQNVADASNTTILRGSTLILTKMN